LGVTLAKEILSGEASEIIDRIRKKGLATDDEV